MQLAIAFICGIIGLFNPLFMIISLVLFITDDSRKQEKLAKEYQAQEAAYQETRKNIYINCWGKEEGLKKYNEDRFGK